MTFLFYELQRSYRIFERLYRVQPVVLVAQEFPQPGDIDQAWLSATTGSFGAPSSTTRSFPTLNTLAADSRRRDRYRGNAGQRQSAALHCQQLRQELAIADARTAASSTHGPGRLQAAGLAGLFGFVEDQSGDVITAEAAKKMGDMIFSGDAAQNQSNRQAMQERTQQAATMRAT